MKKPTVLSRLRGNGGDEEDRTPDLGIANAALSQLSYIPNGGDFSVLIRICEAVWRVLV